MSDDRSKCITCGKEINPYFYPFCLDCLPYRYPKRKHPHQKIRETKEWKINREKRLKESGDQCDWCKSSLNKPLVIHHSKRLDSTIYEAIWKAIVQKIQNDLIKSDDKWKKTWDELWTKESIQRRTDEIQRRNLKRKKAKKKDTCPSCGKASLSERKTKKPKYRCKHCTFEFEKPKIQIPKHYYLSTHTLKKKVEAEIRSFFKSQIIAQCFAEVNKQYQEEVNKYVEVYLTMRNTLVLCKKCHYAIERGMKLCPECNQNYIYPRYQKCVKCSNDEFFKKHKAYYVIEETEKHYVIRSIYDKKLVGIIQGLWHGSKWDPQQEVWKIKKYAFHIIQKKLLDYLMSTGKVHNLGFVKDDLYNSVKEELQKKKNYREDILSKFSKCNNELEGFCNHEEQYTFGEKYKCNKLNCHDYYPNDGDFTKLTDIITKLHIIDNIDNLKIKEL